MKKTTVFDILNNILENNEVSNPDELVKEFMKFRRGEKVTVPLKGLTSEEWEKIPPQLTTSFLSMDTTIIHFLFYITNTVSIHESRVNGRTWEETLHEHLIEQPHPVKRFHMKGVDVLVFCEVLCDYLERCGVTLEHNVIENETLFTPPLDNKTPFLGTQPLNSLLTTARLSRYVRRLRVALQEGGTCGDLTKMEVTEDLPSRVNVHNEELITQAVGISCAIQSEFYLDSPLRLLKYPSMRKIADKLGVGYTTMLSMFRLQKSGTLNTVVDGSCISKTAIKELAGELERVTFMNGGVS